MATGKIKDSFSVRLKALVADPKTKVVRAAFLILLLVVGLTHLKSAFLAQLAMNKGSQMADFSRSLTHPDALSYLAAKEHLTNGNLPRAMRLYRKSLAYFALHVPSWLGIIELFNDLNQQDKAVAAFRYLESFAANNENTAWTKALLADQFNQEKILIANLNWLAANHPRKLQEIFSLAELRWQIPEEIMKHFKPENYPELLQYYIKRKNLAGARAAWEKIDQSGLITRETALHYINFLLHHDDLEQAVNIWENHFLQDDDLLYNPDLREPFLGSGFAWRIRNSKGVSWQPMQNRNGLQIHFDGTENDQFYLQQIVPLQPGEYIFKGQISSSGLTTDQHPYWSLRGYNCDGLQVTGSMLPATSDRQEFILPFTVPDSCLAVRLSLRRNTSYFFDNKIAGTLTIDGLEIKPLHFKTTDNKQPSHDRNEATRIKLSDKTGININRIQVHE